MTSDVIFSFGVAEDGSVTPDWVGGAHQKLTGYSVAEMAELGISSWDPLIHPDDKDRWQQATLKLLDGEQTSDEYRLITKDGATRWVRVTSIPERTGDRIVKIVGSAVDVTEQRLAEERYRAIADLVTDVAFELRIPEEGAAQLVWVTGSLERITGFRAEEWWEHGWRILIHPDDQPEVERLFDDAGERGKYGEVDARVVTKTGEHRWVHLTVRPQEEEGRVTKILAAARDVTVERRARDNVAAALARLNEAQALAGLGTWHWDEQRGRLTGSSEFAQILGVEEPVDLRDEEFFALVHPHDLPGLRRALDAAERELSTTGRLEFRTVKQGRDEAFVMAAGRALVDDHGGFAGFLGTVIDMTDHHRMERALRESEERYRSLVELSPFPIVIQRDGAFVYANPAAAQFLAAQTPEALVGHQLLDVVVAEQRTDVAARMQELRADEEVAGSLELPLVRFDGQVVYAEIRWAPVWFEGDPAVQIVAHDVTEQRLVRLALENALKREREAVDRLKEADRVKDAFLTQISHELRTPLTPIVGFALTLRDRHADLAPDDRTQILDIMVSNADQMARMVERLLDFTQLQAGELGVHPEPLDLAETVGQIVRSLAPLTRRHRVELDVPRDLVVWADSAGLDRVFGNLVANAVKYAPAGSTIRIHAEADVAVTVTVEDEGPGIPPDLAVFDRFVQGPEQPAGHHGTGVGLAVAQAYVHMMGGEISVDRGRGNGARFRFTLPLAPFGVTSELQRP